MRSNRHDWSRFRVIGIVTLVTFSGFPIPTMAQQGDIPPPTKEELLPPHEITLTFDSFERGRVPASFSTALTGGGGPVSWVIQEDPTAPSGSNVLAQTSADQTDYRFPVCVYDKFTAKDVEVSVKFKAVSGTVDQAAGLVARFKDKDNYYVVRANALEDNVRLYKVVGGSRKPFAGTNVKVSLGAWHTLALAIKGRHFEIIFDGRLLFTADDRTFEEAGKVGLWTKADSVTYFDDLRVSPLK